MKNKIEIIANSILTIVGIAGGVLFYKESAPGLSSIMFSIALACILYQFLGGISQDHSVQLGVIKLGGTAAVLVMFMLFLNNYILGKDDFKIESTSEKWIPIDVNTGKIATVTVKHKDEVIEKIPNEELKKTYKDNRANYAYKLVEDSCVFRLKTMADDETFGQVKTAEGLPKSLFRKLDVENVNDVIRFYMSPDSFPPSKVGKKGDSSELPDLEWVKQSSQTKSARYLPFDIIVSETSFSIMKDGKCLIKDEVFVPRKCFIVPHEEQNATRCSYVIFLEQADSEGVNFGVRFSKWLVKKVEHAL